MQKQFAKVYLLDAPFCIDRPYDYFVPIDLRDKTAIGTFVSVPFGNGNRPKLAVICDFSDVSESEKTKPILSTVSADVSLDQKMLGLAFFMKEQTLCTVGDAIRSMVPSAALSRLIEFFHPSGEELTEAKRKKLSPLEVFIYDYVCERGSASLDSLKAKFGANCADALITLISTKLITKELVIKDSDNDRLETVYFLTPEYLPKIGMLIGGEKLEGIRITSQKHKDILSVLASGSEMTSAEICASTGLDSISPQLKALCTKGLISKGSRRTEAGSVHTDACNPSDIVLNSQQSEAYNTLCSLSDSGQPKAALLLGVTGSGKTSVILKLIDRMLEMGKGAIVLLPEIALTPQSISIFSSRYGGRVSVIHSGISQKERSETYLRIRSGSSDVVLGTRSAIFAPVKNLGLIVIDEEQEHTYKSDMNPKYHARDIARYRCAEEGALMLLASATPSLESYKKAIEGKYTLIRLTERYGGATLPDVIIADMRQEVKTGNITPIGTLLTTKLLENQKENGQSILFINRRGYNTFISCRSCGKAVTCPRCSVAMTYHTKDKSYDSGELICHWCGAHKPLPKVCPECGGDHLARMGYGTQRIEQELYNLMEGTDCRILRMDTDTTGSKDSYDKLLGSFRKHEADILLGTQMVTKGHDFPDVTLVGVLLADASLYLDDYRASERTFAMLTQVIGRAGRGRRKGLAIIQTNNPDSETIRLACAQDYETFAARELNLRKLLTFPPYCDIVLLTLSCHDEKELMLCSKKLYDTLSDCLKGSFSDVICATFGPFEAPVYRVDSRYRMRMVVKCRLNRRTRELFAYILDKFSQKGPGSPLLAIDLNPTNL